ncbi:MAG: MBG domain-containing protein [Verrucomicrobiota bacterium]
MHSPNQTSRSHARNHAGPIVSSWRCFLAIALGSALPFAALGATAIQENFNDGTLDPALQDADAAFTISGGVIRRTSAINGDDRRYIRSVASDFHSGDWTYEVAFIENPSGQIFFIGLGEGVRGPALSNEPRNSATLRIHSTTYGGGGRVDVAVANPGDTGGHSYFQTIGFLGRHGTFHARIQKTGNQVTFSILDTASGTISGTVNIATQASYLNGTNSRLFFGSSLTSAAFDDVSISLAGPPPPPPSPAPLPSDAVSWWKAENNANDSVDGNNGILINGAGFSAGLVGQAINLNGFNQRITVPNAANFQFGTSTDFTIEGWIKLNGSQGNYAGIFANWSNPDGRGYQLVIVDNRLAAEIHSNPEFAGVNNGLKGSTVLNNGAWHHVAMVVTRSSQNAKLYVDGVVEANVTHTVIHKNLSNPAPIYIGSERFGNPGSNPFFGGNIDELTLYGRALSTAEIQAIYNANSAGKAVNLNHAPVGANNTVTTLQNQSYTFATADYGFSDPNDNPPHSFYRVRITSAPAAGALTVNGNSVHAGDFVAMTAGPAGAVWTSQAGSGVRDWVTLASSADGTKLAAGAWGDYLYTSTDSGVNWTARLTDQPRSFYSIASSADGTKLVAGTRQSFLFTSTDSGVTWTPRETSRFWTAVASSADGTKLVATDSTPGYIYTSSDSGVTWTVRTGAGSRGWSGVASSSDGVKLVAVAPAQQIYTSTDSGVTWTARESARIWLKVASSADGAKLAAIVENGQIYTSTDSGATWTARESNRNWSGIASSADGTVLLAGENGGKLYVSTDSGLTWTPRESNRRWRGFAMSSNGTKMAAGLGGQANAGTIYTSTGTPAPLVFTPTANGFGTPYASFTFQVQDDGGTANGGVDLDPTPRTMTINVTPLNRAPVAMADAVTLAEDSVLQDAAPGVLANDTDQDNDSLTAILVNGSTHGQVILQPNGAFSYTPAGNYNGPDSFSYKANDGRADSGVVTVSITVTSVNDAPIVANPIGNQTTAYGSVFSFTVPANTFTDADASQVLSYAASGLPPGIAYNPATRTLSGTATLAGVFSAQVIATDNGTPALSAAASFTFAVAQAALTIKANDQTKVYGAALPALSAGYSGFVNGDTAASLDTPATLSTTATAASDVGAYPISVTGAADVNYAITFVPGTLHITPANLLIAADDKSKIYGTALPMLTASYTGFVNGDTEANLDTPASLSTTASPTSSVGTYPITVSGAADANYTITFIPGTLTVDKALLSITADHKTRIYGAANPELTGTLAGVVNDDNITASYATGATEASAVGQYSIVPMLQDPDNRLTNYTVSVHEAILTVTAAPLSVTANDASRAYGAANPAFTGVLSGVQNNDNITATYSSAAIPGSAVGNYAIVPTLEDPDGKLGNYDVTSINGTLTVHAVPLTVTANDASRDYGQENPPLTGTLTGVVNNDLITATYSTAATATSPVGTYPIVPSLFDPDSKLGNYIVTRNNGTLTVNNVPPVVNAGPDQEKVAGDVVTFTGSFTDPSSPSHSVEWNFGDESANVTGTLTPTHIFDRHGSYTVTLTVTDSHGASTSDALTVTVISASGLAEEAVANLAQFAHESRKLADAIQTLNAALASPAWMDEMHLSANGGDKVFNQVQNAVQTLEQLLKQDSKNDKITSAAQGAVKQALADLAAMAQLLAETLHLENQHLTASDPKKQKAIDALLANAEKKLISAEARLNAQDYSGAIQDFQRAWGFTQTAIKIAAS